MKFGILARDYGGTIARDGALDPDVRNAILEARTRAIVVVLVTGRILSGLKEKLGEFRFVDVVVAENGAVLAFPNGQPRLLGNPPPKVFLEELRRRSIEYKAGQCIVEADADLASQMLTVIRELELPVVLLFNRSRVMVLPQAIRAMACGRHSKHFVSRSITRLPSGMPKTIMTFWDNRRLPLRSNGKAVFP
jgi:hypothetical protein